MHWLRRAFIGAATAWPMALLLAPVAAARTPSIAGYGFALAVYAAGSLICHQRPERSFHLLGVQLPVCARCMGIYVGAAAAACLVSVRTARELTKKAAGGQAFSPGGSSRPEGLHDIRPDFGPAPRTVLIVSAIPAAATLLFEWTTGHTPGNWTRAVSGVPIGAAVAWIVCMLR